MHQHLSHAYACPSVSQALTAAQQHADLAKVSTVAGVVSALDQQLRAAESEAAQLNAREGLLGRTVTDYSNIKQLADVFDPFLQFWTAAATWKVGTLHCAKGDLSSYQSNMHDSGHGLLSTRFCAKAAVHLFIIDHYLLACLMGMMYMGLLQTCYQWQNSVTASK